MKSLFWVGSILDQSVKPYMAGLSAVWFYVLLLVLLRLVFVDAEVSIMLFGLVFLAPAFLEPKRLNINPIPSLITCFNGWQVWISILLALAIVLFVFSLLTLITITLTAIITVMSLGVNEQASDVATMNASEVWAAIGTPAKGVIAGLLFIAFSSLVWVTARLGAAPAASAFQGRVVVLEAWHWTRPLSGRIFLLYFLLSVFLGVSTLAINYPQNIDTFSRAVLFGVEQLCLFSLWAVSVAVYLRLNASNDLENDNQKTHLDYE